MVRQKRGPAGRAGEGGSAELLARHEWQVHKSSGGDADLFCSHSTKILVCEFSMKRMCAPKPRKVMGANPESSTWKSVRAIRTNCHKSVFGHLPVMLVSHVTLLGFDRSSENVELSSRPNDLPERLMVVPVVPPVRLGLSAFLAVEFRSLSPLQPHGPRVVLRPRLYLQLQTATVVPLQRRRVEFPPTVIARQSLLVNILTLTTLSTLSTLCALLPLPPSPTSPTLRHAQQFNKTLVLPDISVLLRSPRRRWCRVVRRRRLRARRGTWPVPTSNAARIKRHPTLHIPTDLRVVLDPVCGKSPMAMRAGHPSMDTFNLIHALWIKALDPTHQNDPAPNRQSHFTQVVVRQI